MVKSARVNQRVETKFEGHTETTLIELMLTERFQVKIHKSTLTIAPYPEQAIKMFRTQEAERYKYPEKPWVYYNYDGTTTIVGPVAKKKPPQSQKPREHA